MASDDPHDLGRFVAAQAPVIERVRAELAGGDKRTHWMWFVFPQLKGLGSSAMAERYGLASIEEARAYLAHPLLGARLRDCTALVLHVRDRSLRQIFGPPDDLKFCSSMTLFERAAGSDLVFQRALERCPEGRRDARTLARLDVASGPAAHH
ncbi:MAG: DUF1810 domain-containing protein [Caldimonas sp.]